MKKLRKIQYVFLSTLTFIFDRFIFLLLLKNRTDSKTQITKKAVFTTAFCLLHCSVTLS